jgi:hypothetical protein
MNTYTVSTKIDSSGDGYGNIDVAVYDSNGNLKHNKTQKVDSFVRNYWYNQYHSMVSSHYNVSNPSELILSKSEFYNLNGNRNVHFLYTGSAFSGRNNRVGILIGESNTPVSYLDINLGSQIPYGENESQIFADYCNVGYDNATGETFVKREFFNKNTLSSAFSVSEIGLAVSPFTSVNVLNAGSDSNLSYLYVRDVFDEPIIIEQGDRATFQYRFKISDKPKNFNNIFINTQMGLNSLGNLFQYNTIVSNTNGNNHYFRFYVYSPILGLESPFAQSKYGLVVGSNSTAMSIDDYSLKEQIQHGFSNNQLVHYAMSASPLYEDNTNGSSYFYISRTYGNRSAQNVNINELATYVPRDQNNGDDNMPIMLERYVFSNQINVAPNENIEIRWHYNYSIGASNTIPPTPISGNFYNIELDENGTYMASVYSSDTEVVATLSENGNYMANLLMYGASYSINLAENGTYMANVLNFNSSYSIGTSENGAYMVSNIYTPNSQYVVDLQENSTYMVSELNANVT